MPILSTAAPSKHSIDYGLLSVSDMDKLAKVIAYVMLGRRSHAQRILENSNASTLSLSSTNIKEAIDKLECPRQRVYSKRAKSMVPSPEIIHRDGWLLQIISWIFHKISLPEAYLKTPHSHSAGKGFDGLLIQMDGSIVDFVLLFEEKATNSPRSLVTSQIWPEFETYESGSRDNEMTAEASTLLALVPDLDIDEVTATASWYNVKRYCATVATSESRLPADVELFEGYDDIITGGSERRMAKLLSVDHLRPFFEDLSQKAIAYLKSL